MTPPTDPANDKALEIAECLEEMGYLAGTPANNPIGSAADIIRPLLPHPANADAGNKPDPSQRDWPDSTYQNECAGCERYFMGGRGAFLCKLCWDAGFAKTTSSPPPAPSTELHIGDIVKPKTFEHVLACGSGIYPDAVCVSVEPFVLVSEEADMLWHSTLGTPSDYEIIGKVNDAKMLARCMRRLLDDEKTSTEQTRQGGDLPSDEEVEAWLKGVDWLNAPVSYDGPEDVAVKTFVEWLRTRTSPQTRQGGAVPNSKGRQSFQKALDETNKQYPDTLKKLDDSPPPAHPQPSPASKESPSTEGANRFLVVVGNPDWNTEVYRFYTDNPAVASDIEFMAGKTVGYASNEDPEEQARVEQIWEDHFANKVAFCCTEDHKSLNVEGARLVCFEKWGEKAIVTLEKELAHWKSQAETLGQDRFVLMTKLAVVEGELERLRGLLQSAVGGVGYLAKVANCYTPEWEQWEKAVRAALSAPTQAAPQGQGEGTEGTHDAMLALLQRWEIDMDYTVDQFIADCKKLLGSPAPAMVRTDGAKEVGNDA